MALHQYAVVDGAVYGSGVTPTFTVQDAHLASVNATVDGTPFASGTTISGAGDHTLVVNLPGSPGGCRDGFAVLQPALRHALELLAGEQTAHRQT